MDVYHALVLIIIAKSTIVRTVLTSCIIPPPTSLINYSYQQWFAIINDPTVEVEKEERGLMKMSLTELWHYYSCS